MSLLLNPCLIYLIYNKQKMVFWGCHNFHVRVNYMMLGCAIHPNKHEINVNASDVVIGSFMDHEKLIGSDFCIHYKYDIS